jgi:hypothetical protein
MAIAAHMVDPLAADLAGEERAKSVPPQPHRLMGKVEAALEEQVLHVPQRQRKADVEHHHFADHLGCRMEIPKRARRLGS